MEVQKAYIEIGADSSRVLEAFKKIGEMLTSLDDKVRSFGSEINTEGSDRLAEATRQIGTQAKQTAGELEKLGNSWGAFAGGVISKFIAPLTATLGIGSMARSYTSNVAEMARITGRWTGQMEEWRRKRELFSRVTKEDIELYRKSKLGVMDFKFAMSSLSSELMRSFSPVARKGLEWLSKISDWIRSNEINIVRFLKVIAGVLTAAMIPAFMKLSAAILSSPLTWLIAALGVVALLIDDLVVYMRGGKSAFSDFWSQFGTGEEIAEKIAGAWTAFKSVLEKVKETIRDAIAALNIPAALETVWGALVAVGERLAKAWERTQSVFGKCRGAIEGLINLLPGFDTSMISKAFEKLGGVLDCVAEHFEIVIGLLAGLAAFKGFGALLGAFDTLKGGVGAVSLALKALGALCKSNPILLLLSLLIALTPIVIEHWDEIKDAVISVISKLSEYFNNFKALCAGVWESIASKAREVWEGFLDWFIEKWNAVVARITGLVEKLKAVKNWFGNEDQEEVTAGRYQGTEESIREISGTGNLYAGLRATVDAVDTVPPVSNVSKVSSTDVKDQRTQNFYLNSVDEVKEVAGEVSWTDFISQIDNGVNL